MNENLARSVRSLIVILAILVKPLARSLQTYRKLDKTFCKMTKCLRSNQDLNMYIFSKFVDSFCSVDKEISTNKPKSLLLYIIRQVKQNTTLFYLIIVLNCICFHHFSHIRPRINYNINIYYTTFIKYFVIFCCNSQDKISYLKNMILEYDGTKICLENIHLKDLLL